MRVIEGEIMKSDWAESIEKMIKSSPNPSMRKIEEGFVLFEKIKNIINIKTEMQKLNSIEKYN